MRRQQMTAKELLKAMNEAGKHKIKMISKSRNGEVHEHFQDGKSVGFTFAYPDGRHEYRKATTSV